MDLNCLHTKRCSTGKPPLWSPLPRPLRLRPDSGDFFRDPNAARYPEYPTQPAVEAVLTQNPEIDTGEIDVFACASTFGHLLRFVRNNDKKGFRFNVELIGKTVFFIRKEGSPTALIEDIRGFGHTFPEAYTTWEPDVKRSISHQRIVKYKFAHLNCLVRFGSDGYHKDLIAKNKHVESKSKFTTTKNLTDELEDLSVTGGKDLSASSSKTEASLLIRKAGNPIPQHAVFEIKTKHGKYPIDMSEIYPRLWVCQVPNFILAYHDRAVFSDIRKQDLRSEISKWEKENNEALCKLAVLMGKIVSFVKDNCMLKLEVIRKQGENLEIRKQFDGGKDALLKATKARWTTHVKESSAKSAGCEEIKNVEDDEKELDYTGCSEEECGYCGRCTY
jgi:hypothetical protein